MSKVRINDLARELEVKSKAILDALPLVGVTEKKTHSSSLEEHEAEKVRVHLRGSSEAQTSSARSARPLRGEEEIKTKIDLSHISRPGDVLKAITQQKEAVAPPPRPAAPPPVVARAGGRAPGGQTDAASGCAGHVRRRRLRAAPSASSRGRRSRGREARCSSRQPSRPPVVAPPRPACRRLRPLWLRRPRRPRHRLRASAAPQTHALRAASAHRLSLRVRRSRLRRA